MNSVFSFSRLALVAGLLASSGMIASSAHAQDAEARAIGRCDIPASTALFSRTSSGLPANWVVKTTNASHGSALPAVMVDGWPAREAPADILLGELAREAGFTYEGPGALPVVSWDGKVASMEDVVKGLVSQFSGHWTFDGETLTVSKTVPAARSTAVVDLPEERDLRLATVDVLRAYDLDVSVSGSSVTLSGSADELAKARKALGDAKSITVLDVVFLRGRPAEGRYDWNALGAVKSNVAGAGGSFVFTDPEPEALIQRMVQRGDLVEDSAQSVAAPAGWGLAVPPSQCGTGNGEVVVTSKANGDRIDLSLEGSMLNAEFPEFVLGSTAASVASVPEDGWIRAVLVRPRLVTFSSR